MNKKSESFKYLGNEKSFLHEIKIIFKELLLKQIKETFLEDDSPTLSYG